MKVRVLQSARGHLAEGIRFYEDQEVGLGLEFLRSLLADMRALATRGGVHSKVFGFHRRASKRFPSTIYCLVDGDVVNIHAVLDGRRSPAWVRRRPRESEWRRHKLSASQTRAARVELRSATHLKPT